MARVPIIKVGPALIVTVTDELNDHDALVLQEDLNAAIERTQVAGVLLDLSAVDTVDSFLGRLLNEIAQCARLLGAATVISGIQPAVAITLVELGLALHGVRTALDSEKGLALLHRGLARKRMRRRRAAG
jgi:rsbT antagonist protein RsbS